MTDNIKTDGKVTRPSGFLRLLPSVIIVFVSAIAIPFGSEPIVGAIASGMCAFFLIATAKKKVPVLLLLLLLVGTFGLPNGLPAITLILALVTGTGTYAWLISYSGSPYLAIIPVLAYSVTTVVTKNWFGSLLAAVFVIPALIMAHSFKVKAGRLSSLCRVSASFLAVIAAGVLFAMLYFLGEIRPDVIKDYVSDFSDLLTSMFSELEIELMNGQIETLFSPEDAANMASRIVTVLPAVVVLIFNVAAFFAQRLFFSLARTTMGDGEFTNEMLAFIVSPGAGIVFVLSSLISMFTNATPTGYAVDTVCQNLFIILLPPLLGMGFMYFFARMAEKRRLPGPLMIVAISLLFFINLRIALMLVACFGAYASVAVPLAAFMRSKMNSD